MVALVVMSGLTIQLYNLYKSNAELRTRLAEAREEEEYLSKEQTQLQADMSYFANPENLAKELKAKFDYKRPGEKLIKIQ